MNKPKYKQNTATNAFTLLELMVVVIIVGILAAVAVPKFTNYKHKAIAAEAIATVGAMNHAAEILAAECPSFDGHTGEFGIGQSNLNKYGYIEWEEFCGTYFGREQFYESRRNVLWDPKVRKFTCPDPNNQNPQYGLTSKAGDKYVIFWENNKYNVKVLPK